MFDEQRVIIKFLSWEGVVKPVEILRRLTAWFADKTFSRIQVYEWHKKKSDTRESVQNEIRACSPRTSTSETNILATREMIEWKIAAHVGISYGIISDDLGYRKMSARWGFLAS